MLDIIARLLLSAGILYGTTELPTPAGSAETRISDAAAAPGALSGARARLG